MKELSTEGRAALLGLTPAGWQELRNRLKLYTYANFGHRVRGRFNLDEVIEEAIEDTYFGKRRLPSDVDLELTFFLCEVIRSKMSHLLEREKRDASFEELEVTSPQIHLTKPFGRPGDDAPLAEHSAEAYQNVSLRELRDQIRAAAGSHPLLQLMAKLLISVPDLKPGELAALMNQPVKKVENLRKILRRRLGKILRRR